MTTTQLRQSAVSSAAEPPPGRDRALRALWFDARGDWARAHQEAQEDPTRDGSWVHAYLHRREGDTGNAGYWYARAGRPAADGPLEREWDEIAGELLGRRKDVRRPRSPS